MKTSMTITRKTRHLLAATGFATIMITGGVLSTNLGAQPVSVVGEPGGTIPGSGAPLVDINIPAKPEVPPALRLGPNQAVTLHLSTDQRQLGTGTTDANGALVTKIPLPIDLKTGSYTIEVRGASAAGTPISVTHQIDVTTTVSGVTTFPSNSSDSPSTTTTLLGALSLGFAAANLVLIQRFRKRRTIKQSISVEPDIQLS
ncbi:MAG: hypothetical protein ACSLFB_00830 [Acidimicrobiales bacterium]